MKQIAIYANSVVKLGLDEKALINIDFANNRNTTQFNYNIVPHDFIDGFYWDKTPLTPEDEGQYLIVDEDFEVWYKVDLMEEDKQAMENDTDELCEDAFIAVINLVDQTFFNKETLSWDKISC